MQNKLMVFREGNMVIAYGTGYVNEIAGQLPDYERMTKEDQGMSRDGLDNSQVMMYFLASQREYFNGRFSILKSPIFGDLLVEDPNGELSGPSDPPPQFDRPVLNGQVLGFPAETLPFILNALASISVMTPSLAELSDSELNSIGRIVDKVFRRQR